MNEVADAMLSNVNGEIIKYRSRIHIFEDDTRLDSCAALLQDLSHSMTSPQQALMKGVTDLYDFEITCVSIDVMQVTSKRSSLRVYLFVAVIACNFSIVLGHIGLLRNQS
jgi:hypothetical protein